ncbi:hypothetical protein BO94DRAFT_519435 [Aspergillus sclerotioniger CBS 115572]|uniref:Uncharacterized protein n=1 Tax=Aspergillus sclerotioniger CBS 115572 TaxID=1450535 RepID=A0A317WDM6_9EURO|nr:hypothetical protein BO94DRAFT_519435 [Aspergillus sclerotioniger CBS 115572]PWY83831.1 hypothetical protein BO94DRAFT_519435 [Aspergillus sclerotioniger CBS 115572]
MLKTSTLEKLRLPTTTMDDIAIVGLSIKFPGDAETAESFWSMLLEKQCAMEEWPKDRFNLEAFANPKSKGFVSGAHFMKEDCGLFDASFFGVSGTEACAMDPQARLLLEAAYRALENGITSIGQSSGMPIEKLSGSKTAVFNGCMADDYRHIITHDPDFMPKYTAVGSTACMLANRLSWFFNFRGPSVNLDSACSSSLMALDLACQSLRNGDSDMALVTGCNIIIGIEPIVSLIKMGFTSPDGRCFSFDARANGYGRGEGVGVVVIKRVGDAIRDGDTIRAVIRSTGSNQDGHTPGLTQPSKDAQAHLILDTYEKAGLDLSLTRYFEAHGTGTAIGDPIEAEAVGSVFRTLRSPEDPLYIGAVKSNIGHLEGGSGIAGIVKAVMVLENGLIPPNANFEHLNPNIDAEFYNLRIPTEIIPWPSQGLRRASVASFGFGGSNSHAILEDAYHYLQQRGISRAHCLPPAPSNPAAVIFLLSADDEGGIQRLVAAYTAFFKSLTLEKRDEQPFLKQLARTLTTRRSQLKWKAFAVADSLATLQNIQAVISQPVRAGSSLGLGYIFTGQGAQYYRMGVELLCFPAFRETMEHCQRAFHSFGCSWSILERLNGVESEFDISDPEYAQPMTTALQISLVELLTSMGMKPRIVIGHSSGEIAAAYATGGLSLESACKVSYYRGALASRLRRADGSGAMLAVNLSETAVEPYLDRVTSAMPGQAISISCINSPSNVTISGHSEAIDRLKSILEAEQILSHRLRTGVAYHSPQMEQVAAEYEQALTDLTMQEKGLAQTTSMISSVTGQTVDGLGVLSTGTYWVDNMTQPVRFSAAMANALSGSAKKEQRHKRLGASKKHIISDWLEIGPHCALKRPFCQLVESSEREREVRYCSILDRHLPAIASVQRTVGSLFVHGHSVLLEEVNQCQTDGTGFENLLTKLPEYPFNHTKRYWYEREATRNVRVRSHPKLDLIGVPTPESTPSQSKWRKVFDASDSPWLLDHAVNGKAIYPATGMIVMAIEGARQLADQGRPVAGYFLHDALFLNPISIRTIEPTETHLHMTPTRSRMDHSSHAYEFQIYSAAGDRWQLNCRGQISVQYQTTTDAVASTEGGSASLHLHSRREADYYEERWAAAQRECLISVSKDKIYTAFEGNGLQYGPSFQVLDDLHWDGCSTSIGYVTPFQWSMEESHSPSDPHVVHPATLDGLGQLGWVALTHGGQSSVTTGLVSTRVREAWISNAGASSSDTAALRAVAQSRFKGLRGTDTSVFALDSMGQLRLWISGMETTSMSGNNVQVLDSERRDLCYSLSWKPDPTFLTPQQLQSCCKAPREARHADLGRHLDRLLSSYVQKAVRAVSERRGTELPSHLREYVAWLDRMLEKSAPLSADTIPQDETEISALEGQVMKLSPLGNLYVTVSKQLDAILDGSTEPQSLLGSDDRLLTEYRRVLFSQLWEQNELTNYIDVLTHKSPQMRILEVGTGSGAMTQQILNSLSRRGEDGSETYRFAHYDCTGISNTHVEQAQARLGALGPRVTFKTLDVERDPAAQGFHVGSYDLVITAWLSHGTRHIGPSLHHIRRLLKPGGKLLLVESPGAYTLRDGFILGALVESWLADGSTPERNLDYPESNWSEALSAQGFNGLDALFRDDLGSCLMVATAGGAAEKNHSARPIVFVVHPDSRMQSHLVYLLMELGRERETGFDTCSIWDINTIDLCKSPLVVFLPELEQPLLVDLDGAMFSKLQHFLCKALDIVWITAASHGSPLSPETYVVDGLARTLCTENNRLSMVTVHLEDHRAQPQIWARHIDCILGDRLRANGKASELQYREQQGMLHIARVDAAEPLNEALFEQTQAPPRMRPLHPDTPWTCAITTPGSVDSTSMIFLEDLEVQDQPIGRDEIEIDVHSVGVNFRDVFVLLGKLNDGHSLGCECAGIVTRVGSACPDFQPGDRVCAVILGCLRTRARCNYRLAAKVPETISLAVACAIPLGGVTIHHSLVVVARLRPGESVLIHSGAGGTGQMAIQLAQSIGARVFVTVGSDEKRDLVKDLYGIPDEQVLFSRDTSFQRHIMRLTNNQGVDVVLNSLAGDGLVASWECIAPYGRFVELGKSDIQSNSSLSMIKFGRNVSFSAVAIDQMPEDRPALIQESLVPVMEMVRSGTLTHARPLQEFSIGAAVDAFRLMQSGRNTGKLVINLNSTDLVRTSLRHLPSYSFPAEATYVIAGGLGGLGRSAARWMASMGAKNLILLSRSGPQSVAAQALVRELTERGVEVRAPKCDATIPAALASALEHCNDLPPIRGCIQATMVLQDTIFESLTFDQWNTTLQSKVQSTQNLHTLLPTDLDFFILLSSLAGIIGTVSQANYAAGNTFQDAFAAYRRSLGQRAISLNLGWMREVGIVAEQEKYMSRVDKVSAMAQINENEFLGLLERCCDPAVNQGGPLDPRLSSTTSTLISTYPQILVGLITPAQLRAHGLEPPDWLLERSMFQSLPQDLPLDANLTLSADSSAASDTSTSAWHRALRQASSATAATTVVVEGLIQKLARALSLSPGEIDLQRSLALQGVDSLLAVELRQWVSRAFVAEVSALDVTSAASLEDLAALVVAASEIKFD